MLKTELKSVEITRYNRDNTGQTENPLFFVVGYRGPERGIAREVSSTDLKEDRVIITFVQEVEGLREAKQHDGVDDAEGEHVACDHAVDHRHERTRQLHCAGDPTNTVGVV